MRDEARLTRNVAIQKKSTADSRSAVPFCTLTGKVTLLQRADARVQAGLVSRRGIFVDHALLNCFVQGGNRLSAADLSPLAKDSRKSRRALRKRERLARLRSLRLMV